MEQIYVTDIISVYYLLQSIAIRNISGLIKEVKGEETNQSNKISFTSEDPHQSNGISYLNEEQQLSNEITFTNQESQNGFKSLPRAAPKKKRRRDENVCSSTELQQIPTEHLAEEECQVFGSFIATKLKNYSNYTRSSVQHAISNILFNADQGKMENYRPHNYTFPEDLEPLHESAVPNFYSVLMNTDNHEVKQEPIALSSNESSPSHNH